MPKIKFNDEIYKNCFSAIIDQCEVTLHTGTDKDCLVERGRFSSTLENLEKTGLLMWNDENFLNIPDRTVEKIRLWAASRGY